MPAGEDRRVCWQRGVKYQEWSAFVAALPLGLPEASAHPYLYFCVLFLHENP